MFWFYHRNQLKRTYIGTIFNDSKSLPVSMTIATSGILSKLDDIRIQLVTIMMDEDPDSIKDEKLENLLQKYLSLLRGFIFLPIEQDINSLTRSNKDNSKKKHLDQVGRSPLRRMFRFQWEDSVTDTKLLVNDALFELTSMLTNYGIWLMLLVRHISLILPMNYLPHHITVMQKILRRSAGVFHLVFRTFLPFLPKSLRTFFDNDPSVLQTYYFQCLAEAWELPFIKVLQDIVVDQDKWELNPYGAPFDPRSLAQLASIIFNNFKLASERIRTTMMALSTLKNDGVDPDVYDQWFTYLEIKSIYYQSWNVLTNAYDRWLTITDIQQAPLIVVPDLIESEKLRKLCKRMCTKYNAKTKQPEEKINRISFLEELRLYILMLKEQLRAVQRPERSQFVTTAFPLLDPKDLKPIPFEFPPFDPVWENDLYSEFRVNLSAEDRAAMAAYYKRKRASQPTEEHKELPASKIENSKLAAWTRWLKRSPQTKSMKLKQHSSRSTTQTSQVAKLRPGPQRYNISKQKVKTKPVGKSTKEIKVIIKFDLNKNYGTKTTTVEYKKIQTSGQKKQNEKMTKSMAESSKSSSDSESQE